MKAEVDFYNVYSHKGLRDFFMREQAVNTFEALCDESPLCCEDICRIIDNYAEENELSLDDVEEMLYNYALEEIANYLCIELNGVDNKV